MFRCRIDDCSNERLYLAKVYTSDLAGVSLLCFMLDSDVKDDLAFVVQTDGWTADFTYTKSFCVLW